LWESREQLQFRETRRHVSDLESRRFGAKSRATSRIRGAFAVDHVAGMIYSLGIFLGPEDEARHVALPDAGRTPVIESTSGERRDD